MLNTYGPTFIYTFLHSFDPGSKGKWLLTFTVKSKEECRYRKTLLNCINLVYMYACTIVYTLPQIVVAKQDLQRISRIPDYRS